MSSDTTAALAVAFLLAMTPSFADSAAQDATTRSAGTTTITILHTNDLHGHVFPWQGWEGELAGKQHGGLGHLASAVRSVRASAHPSILLDAGDTIGDTMEARVTEGSVIVEAMNAIGFDAMTIGNHEPDFTIDILSQRRDEARFPLLAANVRRADGSYFTRPYQIRELDGVKVAILGLGYPNTALTTARKNVEGVRFDDAINTAAQLVPLMRAEGAEIVVLLTHLGLSHDQELARRVPGIDVIVGGHSHNRMRDALAVNGTLIVHAGAHGSDLGRLDLDVRNGRIVAHRRTLIPIRHFPADPQIHEIMLRRLQPTKGEREEVIGTAGSAIVRAQTIAGQEPEKRDAESPADSLFADLIREAAGADVVFLPGVGYGVAIEPGAIQARHLRNLIPHDSTLSRVTLTGREIRSVLERAIQNVVTRDVREKVGGMIQVSGLVFRWDARRREGQRVVSLTIGESEADMSRRYSVVVNGLLAQGGHRQKIFEGKQKTEIGDQYTMVAAAIRKRGTVSPPLPGRITKVTPQ